jgi:RimJ/RimL family protein N-acetyltransferase
MTIRQATSDDFPAIWTIMEPIVRAGETYTYPRDTTYDQAMALWMDIPHQTYVTERDGTLVGTYYIKPNQPGGGSHVCNCGYMVAASVQGQGIARAMCVHSQREAVRLGYRAMQFNFVIETNTRAIALWEKLGFETVGRLHDAFDHPRYGYVDARILYKHLNKKHKETP